MGSGISSSRERRGSAPGGFGPTLGLLLGLFATVAWAATPQPAPEAGAGGSGASRKASTRGRPAPARPAGGEKAGSDDCAAPTPIVTVDFIDSGDTSSATSAVDVIPITCNGYYAQVAGPDHVYAFTVGDGNSLTFRVSTTDDGFDPSIYVVGSCVDGASCVAGAASDRCLARDQPQPASCPHLDSTEEFTFSFSPGDYFFYVDSFFARGGPYQLEVTGSLPVELLEFRVE